MSKKVYVKLGEKAQSFSDPASGLKVLPKQVIELTKKNLSSKKVETAIKGGHLEKVDEKEFNAYQAGKEFKAEVAPEDKILANTKVIHTEDSLTAKDVTKATLVSIATGLLTGEMDETEEDLEKMKKDELVEWILETQEDETEEEE